MKRKSRLVSNSLIVATISIITGLLLSSCNQNRTDEYKNYEDNFKIAWQEEESQSSDDYSTINFDAFMIHSAHEGDFETSIFNFKNQKHGVRISFPKKEYIIFLYFKTKPQMKSDLFQPSIKIPKEPIQEAWIYNNKTEKFIKINNAILNENLNYYNYIAGSEQGRVEAYTDLNGRITRVVFACELLPGGMKELQNFSKAIAD